MKEVEAILLIGPTGSGKTPLGRLLERQGLAGRRCLHFDFGASLRRAAAGRLSGAHLSEAERSVILRSLRTGALLEDEHSPLALKILTFTLKLRKAKRNDIVVLNGLPRHVGQAKALSGHVKVAAVVHLEASAPVLAARIRGDVGRDRRGRLDDTPADIRRKLFLFRRRTLPLLAHYRRQGVPVILIRVQPRTSADIMRRSLGAFVTSI